MKLTPTLSTGALSPEQMSHQLATFPGYRASDASPALRFHAEARRLWGARLFPMMSNEMTQGRYAQAAIACPPTACTGLLQLDEGAKSMPWRNPDAIENIVCLEGALEVRFGQALADCILLGRFDMVSIPANVRHQLVNVTGGTVRAVSVLSIPPGNSYDAVFDASPGEGAAAEALGVRFDENLGLAVEAATVNARVSRFAALVPYKKDLSRTNGLPPEATESLSAGSVYPLIVPEGHVGRSRTAPMYGNQGLYISIAECSAGNDGPPPHSHSDTQESFFCLDGAFEVCSGFDNEVVVAVKPNDLIAIPNNVMRTFRNTDSGISRLLVIIQGPDRMNDTVSFSQKIGEDFARRFGNEIIENYARIKMTFDAEERLKA